MSPAWQPTNSLEIKVDGTPLSDEVMGQLVSASYEDSLTLPDAFEMAFRDPDRTLLGQASFQIGAKVSISVISEAAPGGEPLIAGGEVTTVEVEFNPVGTLTIVRGVDASYRAFGGRRTEAYKNMSYSDVVKKVASRNGLRVGKVDPTSPVFPLLSQANLSDWAFLKSLARDVGYDLYVEDGALCFCRPPASSSGPSGGRLGSTDPFQLKLYEDLLHFRCSVSAVQQVQDVKVRSWDPGTKREIVGSAPAATATATLSVSPAQLAGTIGGGSFVRTETPYGSQTEADAAAKAIAEEIAGSFASFEGTARGNPKLKSGAAVSVGLAGTPFDGKYVLTSTRHVWDEGGYTTLVTVSGKNDRSLIGLVSGGRAASARVGGVVSGIVTNAKDPDKLCRVKVKFPWLSESYESDWARTAQAWAGNGYGSVFVPEVGDEVLVAFEQGDMRRPYVVGGLYNGVDKPPSRKPDQVDASSGKVNRRDLVSRTGHVLSFTEKPGESDGITISTGDGKYVIELNKKDRKIVVNADGTIEIESKGAPGDITIKAAGNLNVQARKISVKAQSGVEIDGGAGKVEIKGMGAGVNIEGTQVQVNGKAKTDVMSSGILTIQGTLVKIN